MTSIILLFILIGWYLLSQLVAEAIIVLAGDPPNEDQSQTLRAGMFLLPVLLVMIVLAYATWHLVRLGNYMRVPWIEPASNNPMDYL